MSILGLHHGDRRTRTFFVGGQPIKRREIYCEHHGFLDLFFVGECEGFNQKHGCCKRLPKASFERAAAVARGGINL